MEQLKKILKTTELKSSDKRPYAVKMAEWRNTEQGHLNEHDGIECNICKNKGIIYSADGNNPVLSQRPVSYTHLDVYKRQRLHSNRHKLMKSLNNTVSIRKYKSVNLI